MATIREKRISGETFFYKFVFSVLLIGFCIAWMIVVASVGGQEGPPSPALACFGLILTVGGLGHCILYNLPLQRVWLGEHGLRVSNFCDEVVVPYAAIASVKQIKKSNFHYVIVSLATSTIFGVRITFVTNQPSSGEDKGVIDLCNRIKAAGGFGLGKNTPATSVRPARSVMADDELDGPR